MEIAIIGAGCRLPGGVSDMYGLDSFWKMLLEGKDCITEIPADRWSIEEYYDPTPGVEGKTYAKHGGFVDNLQDFDPQLFGISPREATSVDPQQRMLLEELWRMQDIEGTSTGVFVGIMNDDFKIAMHDGIELNGYCGTGASVIIAANRISYFLNVYGPSLCINTACFSALIAIHYACQSILRGECSIY